IGLRFLFVEPDLCGVLAELVIELALLGIGQDLESSGKLLELFLRLLVTWIYVRMVFARELAIGLFDLGLARTPRYAQLVVIILTHLIQPTTAKSPQTYPAGPQSPSRGCYTNDATGKRKSSRRALAIAGAG